MLTRDLLLSYGLYLKLRLRLRATAYLRATAHPESFRLLAKGLPRLKLKAIVF